MGDKRGRKGALLIWSALRVPEQRIDLRVMERECLTTDGREWLTVCLRPQVFSGIIVVPRF